ncbi:MAG: DEAD/DEAH box helicase family protein [Solobacterium sp.]|nr:DEAD/DEAH box helicase family protein [Solobacterium sp.]
MRCPRCGNTDRQWFYKGSRGWYCRRCIHFGRALLQEESEPVSLQEVQAGAEEYMLKYPLTEAQKRVSEACLAKVRSSDVLLQCVCGAGKTEMVIETIAAMLKERKKVCFAISRRQVVLELSARLSGIFARSRVVPVCQGYTTVTDGDLIVCTTHQLYRYYRAFDLLILDEPDAFPFKGDPVLHGIAASACRGHCIYLTATPDRELERRVSKGTLYRLVLNQRPHGYPLPEPVIRTGFLPLRLVYLLHWINTHREHPRMIFVPTIRLGKVLHMFLSLLYPAALCTSKTENRDEVIEHFRRDPRGIIVATTVLERGVTIADAQICIYRADHRIFDRAGLIQMAGRAGRTFAAPTGDVLFIQGEYSQTVRECREDIRRANLSCAV